MTMIDHARILLTLAGFTSTACATVQAPQCPSAAESRGPALFSPGDSDEAAPLSQLSVLVNDMREGSRMREHCSTAACPPLVSTFSQHFKRWLAAAREQWLVITVVDGRTNLPSKYQAEYLPEPLAQIRARTAAQPSGRLDRTLADGTRVVVLYGKDEGEVLSQIDKLTFDQP
jgi:hypothetical protein